MRYWMYAEPAGTGSEPIYVIMSDKAVLDSYFQYWSERMHQAGKSELINNENCILDWATVHWASEATAESLARIIHG